jgi:hypothetical protein
MSPLFRHQSRLLLIVVMILVSVGASWSRPVQAQEITYNVDNARDNALPPIGDYCNPTTPNDCTLRQAIQLANKDEQDSIIEFDIPPDPDIADYGYDETTGRWTITPGSPYPAINEVDHPTTIRGQIDLIGAPRIIIDGNEVSNNNPSAAVGFRITSADNTITRLIIINFRGTAINSGIGIRITGPSATGNLITGNYIGNLPGNSTPYPNQRGIRIDGAASENRIGNANDPGARNIISGNGVGGIGNGVSLDGSTSKNVIQGNYIGLGITITGTIANPIITTAPLGNSGYGVEVADSSENTIGGTTQAQRNVISGNALVGVLLSGSQTFSNTVAGNFIGTNQLGTVDWGNGQDGVQIANGAYNNTISGTPSARSVISGNAGYGIRITDVDTTGNEVIGNYIGVRDNGTQRLSNDLGGVRIENQASDNMIGAAGQSNVISGNTGHGVSIGRTSVGLPTFNNKVVGNIIGLNFTASAPISNTESGVFIGGGFAGNEVEIETFNTQIGGSTEGERNILAGNGESGIFIDGSSTLSNTITGNIIGLARSGVGGPFTATAANTGDGIRVTGGEILRIGGPTVAEGNLIAANGGDGISLTDVVSTTIQSNRIGWVVDTATDQLLSLGNVGNGLAVTGNLTTTVTSNLVSGKGGGGIGNGMLFDSINTTEILSNTVTENVAGGLLLSNAFTTTIQANSVTANGDAGISLTDAYTATVQTNEVIDNGGNGVQVLGSTLTPFNIRIADNNIYTNTIGVLVSGEPPNAPQQVSILDNSISRNREVGINLTPNNALALADADNPNHDIDPPIVDPLTIDPPLPLRLKMGITNGGLLSGYVITDTDGELPFYPAACVTCTVQIFKPDPELAVADGQGFAKAAEDVFPDETGYFEVQLSDVATDGLPDQVLLTATDFAGNTSEYTLFTVSRAVEIAPPRTEPSPVFPGQVFTYTHTVTNTGSVNDSFRLSASSSLTWTNSFEPSGPFELRAGESRPVTVTVTVPPGSNQNAAVDLPHTLTVTVTSTTDPDVDDSLENTTTVGGNRKVTFEPLVSAGLTQPGQTINYVHTIRNEGNLTATVNLDFDSTQPSWLTTLNKESYTLGPGGVDQIRLSVTPPDQVIIAGTTAVVEINASVVEDATQDQVLTDTTEIILEPQAILVPDRQGFAAAGETIAFRHTATNLSNGAATFRIEGASSLGSEIRFLSDTSGVKLVDGNSFTVGIAEGDNIFNFLVEITVDPRARQGAEDTVTIFLTDEEGRRLGGASVQDTIRVTEGQFQLYLPIVAR